MAVSTIIALIVALAPFYGIAPKTAVGVAYVESRFDHKAKGAQGEIGIFQIMPSVAKHKGWNLKKLEHPIENIKAGLTLLKEAKANCMHKEGITYLVCYNYGIGNAKKVKHPDKFPYVRLVRKAIKTIKLPEDV